MYESEIRTHDLILCSAAVLFPVHLELEHPIFEQSLINIHRAAMSCLKARLSFLFESKFCFVKSFFSITRNDSSTNSKNKRARQKKVTVKKARPDLITLVAFSRIEKKRKISRSF